MFFSRSETLRSGTAGDCQVCFSELGNDAVVHQLQESDLNIKPCLPIHLKCLQAWVNIQEYHLPTCPSCLTLIYIDKIETVRSAISRMLKEKDFKSIEVLMTNDQFKLEHAAFLNSAESKNGEFIQGLGSALDKMVREDDINSIKALLATNLPSKDNCEAALVLAVQKENFEIVQAIKNHGIVSEKALIRALWNAARGLSANRKIAGLLLEEESELVVILAMRTIQQTQYTDFMKKTRMRWKYF
jgi:hypothetical protein